ncbi:hypothetical protein AVEN_93878-1 [Araneus ventricosus]|uniref:Uncharacterized protein n=1 Tax=Araneus ventricosus TaxID=182803 RepID=A0A4Y2B1B5_ARAVE|nr:hypothetical protein AVEN_93878-1 [Araneus ventricosus]
MISEDLKKFSGSRVIRTIAIGRIPIKLEIHDKAVLHHLDQRPAWCHPIKTIHASGSFTKDPTITIPVVAIPLLLLLPVLIFQD